MPNWLKPEKVISSLFFGTAGIKDFNFRELKKLDTISNSLQVTHRIEIFDGEHSWPPQELCTVAVEWMELQAIKSGLREKDQDLRPIRDEAEFKEIIKKLKSET